MKRQPVSTRSANILQNARPRVGVVDDYIQPAIPVQIGNRQTPPAPGVSQAAAGRGPDAFELAVLQITKKQRLLSIARSPLIIIHDGVNMSVRHDQIQPTVVVIIYEAGAPTEKGERDFAEPCEISHVREIRIAVVVIEHI